MKYQFIADFKWLYPVKLMCQVFKLTRSGYYSWQRRPVSKRRQDNELMLQKIRQIRLTNKKKEVYGSPRMKDDLVATGLNVSKNRVARIMREAGIRSKIKKKYKATTDSNHGKVVADNLVNQEFTAETSNQVWLSDITYIWTEEGWLYLAAVLDVFNREVVGWATSERLKHELVKQAIKNAAYKKEPGAGLIFHSDRGVQYASDGVKNLIDDYKFVQSMSGKGNCYDNAMMESFFHSLKTEHVYFEKYRTREHAKSSLFEYIELFYNRERRHSGLGNLSPVDFEQRFKLAA
jgi:putative transposase